MSLEAQPRFPLATLPTPIHEAKRLREALGGPPRAPRILIKRDDLTGLAFGGNKAGSSSIWSAQLVKLRELLAGNKELVHRLEAVERALKKHAQAIAVVYDEVKKLMALPPEPRRRRIGFTGQDEEK